MRTHKVYWQARKATLKERLTIIRDVILRRGFYLTVTEEWMKEKLKT